ncbi:MAG TPA: hypothetical protein VGC32_01925 [Solirubrobacterales bacterium]
MLILVAAAVFGPHVSGWGFFLDDWANAAYRYYPPGGASFSHVMDAAAAIFSYRPVLIVFTPLKDSILGINGSLEFAWTILLAVIVAALLYAVLRSFKVPRQHAICISALTLVYPWFDSVRFWEATNAAPLAIALSLTGFLVALRGLAKGSLRLHLVAAALYLIAILTYEITLPLILFAGVAYTFRVGWRAARSRWALDLVVVVAGGLWVGKHTTRTVSGTSGDLTHLRQIVEGGATIFARTFLPLGDQSRTGLMLVVVGIILIVGSGVLLWRHRRGRSEDGEWGLPQWMILAAVGLVVAILGWAIFIPADPYYTPSVFGITNRVNALAGYGLVILAYATIGVGCSIVAAAIPRVRSLVPAAVVALAILLGAAYIHVLERHMSLWEASNSLQHQAIAKIKSTYAQLPDGTTLITSGYPVYYTLGVPIFASNWDLDGMLKIEYENSTLAAYPMLEGMSVDCGPDGVKLQGPGAPPTVAPYGSVRLLNLSTGMHAAPGSRAQCLRQAPSYVAGPMYLMFGY